MLDPDTLRAWRRHVGTVVARCPVAVRPFHHLFVEDVLPAPLYEALRRLMVAGKYGGRLQERRQDSAAWVNSRRSLVGSREPAVAALRAIFGDPQVKAVLLRKFYLDPSPALVGALRIHDEFEFVHCAPGRFQDIHVDIPPKFLSFVFYVPEHPVAPADEARNATILYDEALRPCFSARYVPNALCVFAPHFRSYHGFDTTVARDVLVMFYVDADERERWTVAAREHDTPPYTVLLDAVERKLRTHPLIEYGRDERTIASARARCLVNAPKGRVMRDRPARPLPGRPP